MQGHLTTPLPAPRTERTTALAAGAGPRLLLALLLLAAIWAGTAPFASTPAVVSAGAPPSLFSAERALGHLEVIAAAPRPIGSERSAAVRDYLLAELRALGLEPEIQRTLLVADGPIAEASAVENVLVRIPGAQPGGKALLISGHYDSVAMSTGATDCGGCAAAVLEATRAILAGEPPAHDLIVLLTDGEEIGVAGARAFMRHHPWAQDVGLSIVLEGLGGAGGSMLYITDRAGGWIAREALRAGPWPLGYSLVHQLMWSLANNTGSDLDAFLETGGHGLGFITLTLDSAPAYHTLDDSVTRLDLGGVQAHGDWLVSLVRHFGNLPSVSPPAEPPLIFFPLLPGVMVRYPGAWALPLAIGGALLTAAAIGVGRVRRRLALRQVGMGFLLTLLALLSAVALITLTWWALRLANTHLHSFRVGGWYGAGLYLAAWSALTVAVVAAWSLARRRASGVDPAAGALLWWAIVALLTAWAAPGMSYIFVWPLYAATPALLWWGLRRAEAPVRWAQALAAGIPAAVTLLLGAQMVYAFGVYAPRMESLTGLNLAALPVPILALMAALCLPALELILGQGRRRLAPLALGSAVALIAAAWFVSIPTAQRPATNTLLYWLDADAGAARWITLNDSRGGRGTRAQLDPWTAQFFPNGGTETRFTPWLNGWIGLEYPALESRAPLTDAPRSTVRVLADVTEGDRHTVRLTVETPATVLDGQLILESAARPAVTLNGTPLAFVGARSGSVQINRYGRTGVLELEIVLPAGAPLALTVRDRTDGLPAFEGAPHAPRPETLIPAPFNPVADSMIVVQQVRF